MRQHRHLEKIEIEEVCLMRGRQKPRLCSLFYSALINDFIALST